MARKYKPVGCFNTESAAKTEAKRMRKNGLTAKVVGKCVTSAGKHKTTKRKTTKRRKSAK